MGCNFYLLRKTNYTTWVPAQLGCNEPNMFVQHLTNGWVWNNTYYDTLENLNCDYYQRIHIGKSSAGWNFLLMIYPEINIKSIEDWKDWFECPDNKIVDETGKEISSQDMLKIITRRKGPDFNKYASVKEYEDKQVSHANEIQSELLGLSISDHRTPFYSNYEAYMADNGAIRGINGLLAHDPAKNPHIIPGGKDKTYDYIYDSIFS